jgi:thioredoxin-like negative regulator of GroEL
LKVDTEASQDVAAAFGIRSIPSILFIPTDGSQPAMALGVMPTESFEKAIEQIFGIKP